MQLQFFLGTCVGKIWLWSPWWWQSRAHFCCCHDRSQPVNWNPTRRVPGASTSDCWRTSKLKGSSGPSHPTWSAEAALVWRDSYTHRHTECWHIYTNGQKYMDLCNTLLGITHYVFRRFAQTSETFFVFIWRILFSDQWVWWLTYCMAALCEPNPSTQKPLTINIHHDYSNSPPSYTDLFT